MIKQIKMSIKLLRYTFGMKMCIGLGVVFLLCGVAMSLMPEELGLSGSFFLIATAMWATQLFYSLSVSSLVQSSPYKKATQTSMPAIISFISFLGSYAVILLLKLPRLQAADAETQQYMAADLISSGLLIIVIMIYTGIAYKFFVAATVLFFVTFMGTVFFERAYMVFVLAMPSVGTAAVIGLLEIVVGAFLQYGMSLLVYKYPMAKRAQIRSLQKQM